MPPVRPLLVAALFLSACASGADAPDEGGQDEGSGEGGGSTSENASGGGESGGSGGGERCLRGTWAADAEHTFRPETWERLMQQGQEGAPAGAPTIRFGEASGRALLTFAPDGALHQRFEDFRVVFESDAGGMPMRMAMEMSGTNEARYTVDGDRLTFLPDETPGGGDMHATVSVEVGGQQMPPTTMDPEMFETQEGSAGTVVTYTCRGDELLLDIAAEDAPGQLFFDDARYTRAG